MRKALVFACAALFVAAAAFAEPGAPLSEEALSAILGEPAVSGGACALQESGTLSPPTPILKSVCSAQATCQDGTTRSCTGTGTCTSVDNNCDWDLGARGYVTCDGVTTYCPLCVCNDTPQCCNCERYGDCMSCCRCGGGTFSQCNRECYGYP